MLGVSANICFDKNTPIKLQNGEIKHMSVQRGRSLNYLGMNFDLKPKGEVAITMSHHINKVIKSSLGS